jgi:ABC-2 type transport system ATP-binding protein
LSGLPGQTLLVETTEPRGAQRALQDLPGVMALAQIGASLRVLGRDGADLEARVAERLRSAGVAAEVRPTAPNLEDVFVAATAGRAKEAA